MQLGCVERRTVNRVAIIMSTAWCNNVPACESALIPRTPSGGKLMSGPADSPNHPGTTRTLLRGLTLLEMIGEARDGATVTDLASQTGLDKGTASRLLATLRDAGWAYQS